VTGFVNSCCQSSSPKKKTLQSYRHCQAETETTIHDDEGLSQFFQALEKENQAGILDIYSHVTLGLQEAAAENFDRLLNPEREKEPVRNYY